MDMYAEWNQDLVLTASGDIQAAVGWDEARQRIIRRMITNSAQVLPDGTQTQPDDIFVPPFGVGLGKMVDQPVDGDFVGVLERRIALAVLEDSDVDSSIPPNIKVVRPDPSALRITVGLTLTTGRTGEIVLEST